MDTPSALLVALIGAVAVGEAAAAAFVKVTAEEFRGDGWIEHGYEGLTTYRVYAVFDWTSDDGVLSVFAIPESPVIRVASSDGRFHNDKLFDSHTPPQDRRPFGYWSNQWDTYVTVWTDTEGHCCDIFLSPDFADQANGLRTTFVVEDGSWFTTPCCDKGTCCYGARWPTPHPR